MDGLARNWFRRGDCERAQLQPLLLPVTTTNTIAPTNSPSPSPSPSSSPSPLNDKDMVSTIKEEEDEDEDEGEDEGEDEDEDEDEDEEDTKVVAPCVLKPPSYPMAEGCEEERTGLPRGSNECTEEKEKIEGKRVDDILYSYKMMVSFVVTVGYNEIRQQCFSFRCFNNCRDSKKEPEDDAENDLLAMSVAKSNRLLLSFTTKEYERSVAHARYFTFVNMQKFYRLDSRRLDCKSSLLEDDLYYPTNSVNFVIVSIDNNPTTLSTIYRHRLLIMPRVLTLSQTVSSVANTRAQLSIFPLQSLVRRRKSLTSDN
ncbi:hypothetical protein V1477_015812 [Vespula maculifrons]|uniref:Uncharacterized protein n=1 Tax=Vespula maculifrons TaxID=7453 RepID=A0ABD2BB90_VESMC